MYKIVEEASCYQLEWNTTRISDSLICELTGDERRTYPLKNRVHKAGVAMIYEAWWKVSRFLLFFSLLPRSVKFLGRRCLGLGHLNAGLLVVYRLAVGRWSSLGLSQVNKCIMMDQRVNELAFMGL